MRLKEIREGIGATQKAVAEAIGCSATVYSRYERGERQPDIDTLRRLSCYFNVSVDYIICNDR